MEIQVSHTISMGHRLPSYDGICSSPHGHNVRVVVRLATQGFLDFKVAGGILAGVLADLDHAMVLHREDPLLSVLQEFGFRTVTLNVEPTTEAVAQLVFNELSDNVDVREVVVHETDKYAAACASLDTRVWRVK